MKGWSDGVEDDDDDSDGKNNADGGEYDDDDGGDATIGLQQFIAISGPNN